MTHPVCGRLRPLRHSLCASLSDAEGAERRELYRPCDHTRGVDAFLHGASQDCRAGAALASSWQGLQTNTARTVKSTRRASGGSVRVTEATRPPRRQHHGNATPQNRNLITGKISTILPYPLAGYMNAG